MQLRPDPPFSRVAEQTRPPPSKRNDAGANPAAGAKLRDLAQREDEPAEARALFRKQMDRLRRLGRETSVLRHWLVAQKQSARPISEGRRSITVRANHLEIVEEGSSRKSGAAVLTRAAAAGRWGAGPQPSANLPGRRPAAFPFSASIESDAAVS